MDNQNNPNFPNNSNPNPSSPWGTPPQSYPNLNNFPPDTGIPAQPETIAPSATPANNPVSNWSSNIPSESNTPQPNANSSTQIPNPPPLPSNPWDTPNPSSTLNDQPTPDPNSTWSSPVQSTPSPIADVWPTPVSTIKPDVAPEPTSNAWPNPIQPIPGQPSPDPLAPSSFNNTSAPNAWPNSTPAQSNTPQSAIPDSSLGHIPPETESNQVPTGSASTFPSSSAIIDNELSNPTPNPTFPPNPQTADQPSPSPSPLDNPLGVPPQVPSIDNQPAPIQPSWTNTPDYSVPNQPAGAPTVPSEAAPTDLSHLINPQQETPLQQNSDTLIVPSASNVVPEIPTVSAENHKGIPMWLIGVGIGLLVLVVGASAYFILGIGQSPKTTSIPATVVQNNGVKSTPVAVVATPSAQPSEQTATGSANFGNLQGGTTQTATSAAELLRQRQQATQH